MIVGTPELSDLFSRLMSPTFWGSLLEDWPDRFSRLGYWLIGLDREALGNLDHWEFKFANPWPILLVFLTVALLGIYAIWQYGKEPMAGHSRARKFLSVIRMILLYWAFFLLAQPTLILERDAENPSRLAVMLDGSMSMTVPEKYDQKEDLDILERLGLAKRQAAVNPSPEAPAAGTCPPVSLTRETILRSVLENPELNLVNEWRKNHLVKLYRFGSDLWEAHRDEKKGTLLDFKADDAATALFRSVKGVLEQHRGNPLAGIVIFTDGRNTEPFSSGSESAKNSQDALEFLKSSGVKIFAVGLGHPLGPVDLVLKELKIPRTLFVDDKAPLEVVYRVYGDYKKRAVPYHLFRDGTEIRAGEFPLQLDKEGNPQRDQEGRIVEQHAAINDYIPAKDEIGVHEYQLRLDPQDDEIVTENNSKSVSNITVKERIVRVLLVADQANWEFRYLKNALGRDKSVRYSSWLQSADREYLMPGSEGPPEEPDRYRLKKNPPQNLKEWDEYDCVIMMGCDPRGLGLGDASMEALVKAVKERGVGLIIQTGQLCPLARYQGTPIQKGELLPVGIGDARPTPAELQEDIDAAYKLKIVSDHHSLVMFDEDEKLNMSYWEHLPGLYWYEKTGPLNPQAKKVAIHPTAKQANGEDVTLVASLQTPRGNVVFCGSDEFWRWRWRLGNARYYTFWAHAIQFAASYRFQRVSSRVEIDLDKETYLPGDAPKIEVALYDDEFRRVQSDVEMVITDPEGQQFSVPVKDRGDFANKVFSPDFKVKKPGNYILGVHHIGSLGQEMVTKTILVQPPKIEFQETSQDVILLKNMAKETGGAYWTLRDLDEFKKIEKASDKFVVKNIHNLYSAPIMFLGILFLLAIEWILRKLLRLI